MKSLFQFKFVVGIILILITSAHLSATDISGNQSGTLDINGSPYIVVGNVLVPDGNTLTIDPGVEIKFDFQYIFQVDGTLIAEGTAVNEIRFTSNESSPQPGDWGKIYFMQSENSSLDYCTVEYAGAGANPSGINLWFSDVSIQNTTVKETSGSGIVISFSSPIINNCFIVQNSGIGIECLDPQATPIILGTEISNNLFYAISMYGGNIKNIENVTITGNLNNSIRVEEDNVDTGYWFNHDVPYVINGNISVLDGNTLTIEPGCELRFNGNYTFEVNGTLIAEGTDQDDITFTSNQDPPQAGDWNKLYFNNSDSGTILRYVAIHYGGSNTAAVSMLNSSPYLEYINVSFSATNGIYLVNSSPEFFSIGITTNNGIGLFASDFASDPIINTFWIQYNDDYPISMYADNIKNIGEGFMSNNLKNAVRVEGEIVYSGRWRKPELGAYVINGSITVADGETLRIDPGTYLLFNSGYTFEVNGALVADGTNDLPITFTSNDSSPSPGDWRQLSFFNSDSGTILDHCKIFYGGSNTAALNLALSNFSITNIEVKYSEQNGIYLSQSSPTVRNCIINENNGNGIHIMSGRPDLGTLLDPGNNAFSFNGGWEVYNNTGDTIYAQKNYWVDIDSATIDNNHIYDDDENASKGIVLFMPFLDSMATDIEEDPEIEIPNQFLLYQNYPNPFNPITTISYNLPKTSDVKIEIINILGQRVITLINGQKPAGYYKVNFDGRGFPSGVYLYQIQAGEYIEVKKMILLR